MFHVFFSKILLTVLFLAIAALFVLPACSTSAENMPYETKPQQTQPAVQNDVFAEIKRDFLCILAAYPEISFKVSKEGERFYLLLPEGGKIAYLSDTLLTEEEALERPDLFWSMKMIYPYGKAWEAPAENFDPGRIRAAEIFKSMYGNTSAEVQRNLVPVIFLGKRILFQSKNGASLALQEVSKELEALQLSPADKKRLAAPPGAFAWRFIAGTSRLSMHSFGIAIDVAPSLNPYWRWTSLERGQAACLSFPLEAVKIFEKHGFIWGGRWRHFDVMHFEYRPEIIFKSKYFSASYIPGQLWWEGTPEDWQPFIKELDRVFARLDST